MDFDPSPFKDLAFKWGDPNGPHFGKVWLDGRREPKIFLGKKLRTWTGKPVSGSIVYNRILEERTGKQRK